MSDVDRYEKLIIAGLEAQHLKRQLQDKLAEVSGLITSHELRHRKFDHDAARKAFAILVNNQIDIELCQYVKSQAIYKDIKINLHQKPKDINGDAMTHIFEDLKTSEIFGAD